MEVLEWAQFLEKSLLLKERKTSMTVGVFDGVHKGHQELIKRIVSYNAEFIPAAVTFRENHKTTIKGQEDIQSFEERLLIFEKLGIQLTIVIDFTEDFRKMSGIKFLEILLEHGNIGFFAVGSGFRCGCQLDTDAEAIKEFFASHGIAAELVEEITEGSDLVSSSLIRAAIAAGDVKLAEKLLGHDWK